MAWNHYPRQHHEKKHYLASSRPRKIPFLQFMTVTAWNYALAEDEHKFRLSFLDTINQMCSCSSEPENTAHFLLRCQNHVISRSKLLRNVYNLDYDNYDDDHLIHILLYGSEKFTFNLNKEIIKPTICYLKDIERFDESLIFHFFYFLLLYHYYFIASRRWFLTYIYSNFENKLFRLSNLELFIESRYASDLCLWFFFSFFHFFIKFVRSLRAQALLRNV